MCLGSAPARYRRGREGTSSEKVKKRIRALRTAEISVPKASGKPEMAGYDAPAMSEPNTPHDPSSASPWNPAEPGADAPGLASDATQLWDPSEVPTSAATSAGADAPTTCRGRPRRQPPPVVTRLPPSEQPSRPASGVDARRRARPVSRLGVAGGRPRVADEPPTGRKTPPAAIVGSVIGLAIVVALGAWFLLLRPGPNTALASPSPSRHRASWRARRPRPRPPPSRRTKPTPLATPVPTPFKAPTFTGKTLEEAQALAETGGLELDIQFDRTTSQPDGTVLSQAPAPGSTVLPGDQVFLLVAQPGPNVLVPDVQGVAEADAINLLLDSDLEPGVRSEAVDADVPAGSVISTDPVAGKRGRPRQLGRLRGVQRLRSRTPADPAPTPDTVAVPDVTGLDEADAFNRSWMPT